MVYELPYTCQSVNLSQMKNPLNMLFNKKNYYNFYINITKKDYYIIYINNFI